MPVDLAKNIFVKWVNSNPDGHGECFGNTLNELMELYDEHGHPVPCTPAGEKISSGDLLAKLNSYAFAATSAFGIHPEVQAFLADGPSVERCASDFYKYDRHEHNPFHRIDTDGCIGVAKGKNIYLPGAMNPVYPEVADHWMGQVAACIDSGVDGINFRVAIHSCGSDERDAYGFNEPVLERCGGDLDRDLVNRINGDAFTDFLLRAGTAIKRRGLCVAIHVNATFLYPDDRPKPNNCRIPPNCEWQWEKWIREIADIVYLKDMHYHTEAHADHFIDKVSRIAKENGKPVIYVGTNKETGNCFEEVRGGNMSRLEYELAKVLNHGRLDGYDLYEAAAYTRVTGNGRVEGSSRLSELVKHTLGRAGL